MTAGPVVRRNDLGLYDRHATAWWNEADRSFRSLRSVKRFQLQELSEHLGDAFDGLRVIDLGCGGGLLSIPLAARGARVIGIDISKASLEAASAHARQRAVRCTFLRSDLTRTRLSDECADLVLLSDVVEHLERPGLAIAEASRLLVPGGRLFVNTINRTRRAHRLAVTLAEGIGLVPRGTHDPRLFIRPDELVELASHAGLRLDRLAGEAPRLLATLWHRAIHMRRSRSLAVSYSAYFTKDGETA